MRLILLDTSAQLRVVTEVAGGTRVVGAAQTLHICHRWNHARQLVAVALAGTRRLHGRLVERLQDVLSKHGLFFQLHNVGLEGQVFNQQTLQWGETLIRTGALHALEVRLQGC
jgi:hypothetical protein